MTTKIILVLCAQAFFVQSTFSQCTSRAVVSADRGIISPIALACPYGMDAPYGLAGPFGLDAPYGLAGFEKPCSWAGSALDFSPTSGGALPVSSASAIAPVGLAVASDNVYEGILAAAGEVPFVGTVGVEGVLPTAGAGAVNHHCGDGINAMISDKSAFGHAGAYTPGLAGAYDLGLAASGLVTPGLVAPGLAAPGYGYRAGWAQKGCGCGL